MHPLLRVAASCLAALVLGGCGGAVKPSSAATTPRVPAASSPAARACASPPPTRGSWPSAVPRTFPRLPGAQDFKVIPGQEGLKEIEFNSAISLQQAVLFVLKELPKAGYVLGRGDAEAFEADAPFVGGGVRGLLRIDAKSACAVTGLLAIVPTGARAPAELLPAHDTPSPSG